MLTTRPLLPTDWAALEALFGKTGACGGCWCMFWHLSKKDFDLGKSAGNRAALSKRVAAGETTGVLAFDGDQAVGWAAVGPRAAFSRVVAHRNLQRTAAPTTWAVPCFYVAARQRGRGVAAALLAGAVDFARAEGATELEGYPVSPTSGTLPAAFAFTGVDALFAKADFDRMERDGRAIWLRPLRP